MDTGPGLKSKSNSKRGSSLWQPRCCWAACEAACWVQEHASLLCWGAACRKWLAATTCSIPSRQHRPLFTCVLSLALAKSTLPSAAAVLLQEVNSKESRCRIWLRLRGGLVLCDGLLQPDVWAGDARLHFNSGASTDCRYVDTTSKAQLW